MGPPRAPPRSSTAAGELATGCRARSALPTVRWLVPRPSPGRRTRNRSSRCGRPRPRPARRCRPASPKLSRRIRRVLRPCRRSSTASRCRSTLYATVTQVSLCEAMPPSLPVHAQVGYGTAGLRGRVPLTESLQPLKPATAQPYRSPGRSSTASDSTGVCAGPRFPGAKGTTTSHNRLGTNRGSRARSPKSVAECVRSLSQASSG